MAQKEVLFQSQKEEKGALKKVKGEKLHPKESKTIDTKKRGKKYVGKCAKKCGENTSLLLERLCWKISHLLAQNLALSR